MSVLNHVQASGVINKGESGERVLELQRALAAIGHLLTPDGRFGPITALAVESFQRNAGLTPDGIVGRLTAQAIDQAAGHAPPIPLKSSLIYCDFMYGLGDRFTSAGMDVLARSMAAISNRLVISPTISWSRRQELVPRIRNRGRNARNMLFGNSMGANAIPMVTNQLPEYTFDLCAGYDPTIWWSCPAFAGYNVQNVINYHGRNWLNPIGHARYTPAFDGQVETVPTYTLHSLIDDDVSLHQHTIKRVKEVLALSV